MSSYVHLHVHTQFSILDGASNIDGLLSKAIEFNMPAIAITDHGNMFGVKKFHDAARKKGIKPIIGCEAYLAPNGRKNQKSEKDRVRNHLIILAKNITGYQNLVKLISLAYIEGFYYKPRIDKDLLLEHKEGLIISSACLAGEIPRAVRNQSYEKAKEIALEFQKEFGDDFYLEIMDHGIPEQKDVNEALIKISEETGIKLIATNDVHFINAEDADAHDRLICLNTGKALNDPNRMHYTKQEYLKSFEEMKQLFSTVPNVLENTLEIAEKVEEFELNRDPIMPDFPMPEGFDNEDDYLKHLTYEGAKSRYEEITQEVEERIEFELGVIKNMGFPGYFLIVQDFINAAREMDVSVGPGRGSAAGSVVAYSLKITDIDPIKYNLLFERFLNPDRISMPDIDIDFDEDGREAVLRWVVEKYGKERVGHIITFGTMAAKMAIRDVARIEELPLSEADRLAKLVPERPGVSLSDAFKEVKELKDARDNGNDLVKKTLKFAETLEGSVRHTGLHACGIIIGRDDLREYLPVCISKDSDLWVTQYDGKYVEDVGMLKMDFLGLKTLSIIKDAVENVKHSKKVEIDIANIDLDDAETYELYAKGETTGLFQFESPGMKKHLRELKPNRFEDLIAMNALYRPGPMEYIPSFVNRKHGREKIEYDIPEMSDFLEDTYGITVYQEQVMLLSQKLAGFTRGQADSLRKAMGKKIKAMMDDLKGKFVDGCMQNGYKKEVVEKIWHDWEAFAQYAFNKSHSTCYAYVSYQTAYLKAHYPAEFMAAVLSRNLTDIKKITIFMDECKRMGMKVLGPDVNESKLKFIVNKEGNVRFGLAAIKGVGEGPGLKIIEEREQNGPFKDVFDFIQRVDLHSVNKRIVEALARSGAFDSFAEIDRHQFFCLDERESTFVENLLKYGNNYQNDQLTSQQSLFGGEAEIEIPTPQIPICQEWGKMYRLNQEKELIGIYLSAHPLDDYKFEIDHFCNTKLSDFTDLKRLQNKEITVAGIVTDIRHATTKTGKPYGTLTIEDYSDTYRITMFSKDYLEFKSFFTIGYFIMIKGKIQTRMFNENELEFKVQKINMLSDVKESMIGNIKVKMPISGINNEIISELSSLTETKKGNTLLNFVVYDPVDKISVQMFSRAGKIQVSDQLLMYLKKSTEIEFDLTE
jgi:DNA polymerase III subunit alpha